MGKVDGTCVMLLGGQAAEKRLDLQCIDSLFHPLEVAEEDHVDETRSKDRDS